MNVRDLTDGTRGPDEEAAFHIGNLLPYWAAVPLFLLVTVPLLWRRVAPLAAAGAALAGLVVNLALVGSEYVRCGVLLPTAFLLAYATGARLDRRGALLGLLITGSFTVLDLVVEFDPATAAVFAAVTAAMWGVGRLVHARGLAADELRAQTDRAAARTRRACPARGRRRPLAPEPRARRGAAPADRRDRPARRRGVARGTIRPRRPRCSRRSSARAGRRWRRCARPSACCAPTRRSPRRRRSRRSPTWSRCSPARRARTPG